MSLDPNDALREVLRDTDDPPTRYRGKVYACPFVQGGKYWRHVDPAEILRAQDGPEPDGPIHYAGLRYVEDEHGATKDGRRELRGRIVVTVEDGRYFLARDAERWELVAPTAEVSPW